MSACGLAEPVVVSVGWALNVPVTGRSTAALFRRLERVGYGTKGSTLVVRYGWDLELRGVPGLEQPGFKGQGTHQDLGGENVERPAGFLVHMPLSEERPLRFWPKGHKVVLRAMELMGSGGEPALKGGGESVASELALRLSRDGVEGVPEVGPLSKVAPKDVGVLMGYAVGMHACLPHCGGAVPSVSPSQACFGAHGYVLFKGCGKGENVTYECERGVMRVLAGARM